jgi:hypothetical protein
LASICWWDYERRELCETVAPPATQTPARAPAVSALELTRGYDGLVAKQRRGLQALVADVESDSHSLHTCMRLSSFIGMSKQECISSARAIVLKMDGATLARFELYYSSPKVLLADLLSDDQCVRASAAQALCDTPVCCLDAGASHKVTLICPSPATLLESKPLQTLLRAWFFYDSSSTTVYVERAHRQNTEFFRGKQHVDVRKWQSQCVLAAHCRQHGQAGERAMTDYVQRLRRTAKPEAPSGPGCLEPRRQPGRPVASSRPSRPRSPRVRSH